MTSETMNELFMTLPPFAPDYSGVASSLFDLGGMIVIHDGGGCTGTYVGYDEPRWMNSREAVYCSSLRHMDAVLGNDDKLIARIVAAAKSIEPRFIALLGSPVPMVIGTDYNGIAHEVEEATGIPSFGFDTKGVVLYDKGIGMGVKALLKRFAPAKKTHETIPNTVNILGMTPIDFGNVGNDRDIVNFLEKNGVSVLCSFSMGLRFDEVSKASRAALNIAVSQAGIVLAKYMQKVYGTPYIDGVPLGDGALFLNRVKAALSGEDFAARKTTHAESAAGKSGKRVLIAGEQVSACALRDELRAHYGIDDVSVAVLFNASEELLEQGDVSHVSESALRNVINEGGYSDIIADPLVAGLIKKDGTRFHALPTSAVSGKVHWSDIKRVLGDDMQTFLEEVAA